ncbi:AcrR family transcriptional regulator [Caulobacter sp. BE264]|uniref:TetR/AcrR family transcriptional regulator n=1 Tax=Caulobacter sp. BE264 TaxID=2817724 RepID=UPI00285FC3B2|nr:TetR/AcrR family transcriptional regulator [Caulobacter sp. BE264]MDR7230991.1 AcrR family transcriptional regulator [Caulobacter sp. BE264]
MLIGVGLKRVGDKREAILGSARAMFLREGYADAGMEVMARTAGISTATLYAYFPSKADLFRTIVMETISGVAAPVREAVRVKGDARTRLTSLATAYVTFFSRPDTRALFRMVTTERRRFPDVAEYVLQSARDELGGAAIAVINDLVKTGELRVEKPSWAAGQLMGMLDHVTLVLGLSAGDDVQSRRPVRAIANDAVETFLARYGAR